MAACGDVPVNEAVNHDVEPAGVLRGTVTYSGPLPCTQAGHVLGSAEILIFEENLLPPPEGFGTSARSLATVSGDVLFAGVLEQLPATSYDPNNPGKQPVACPPIDAPNVTVSAEWSVGPLPAGRYQVRGFYDRDGDFSPILKIHQLPTAGDVGGGALQNAAEAAAGAKPIYQVISLGNADPSQAPDAQGRPRLVMPGTGALIEGISVTLGLVLPFSRPIAYFSDVKDERPTVAMEARQTKPASGLLTEVRMPSDMRFSVAPTKHPATADQEFIRVVLHAGLPDSEAQVAANVPFLLQTVDPYNKLYLYPTKLANGQVAAIPEESTPQLADLFPQALFARLNANDATDQTPTAAPAVLINGIVSGPALPVNGVASEGKLINTTVPDWAQRQAQGKTPMVVDEITVNLRPSVLCIPFPDNPETDVYLVTPSLRSLPTPTDANGEGVIENVPALREKLAARFGRDPKNVKVVEGCLPPGRYSTNLVYDTGQAWTMPNEAGVCQPPTEIDGPGEPGVCWLVQSEGDRSKPISRRPILASQRPYVRIIDEQEQGFCDGVGATASAASPGNGADHLDASDYIAGVPKYCLPESERDPALVRKLMHP